MKPISVMIVDDDAAARDLLATLLRTQFDVKIDSVVDGIDAMRQFRESSYDIIMMDFEMPGMDGLAAIKVINTLKRGQFIIMVSAHSDIELVKKAISLGVSGFLVKPFTIGKIKDVVDKYLKLQGN